MQKRDKAFLAALVIGLLIGAATYALAGGQSRTSISTTTTTTQTTLAATSQPSSGNVSSSGYGSSGGIASNGLRLTLSFLSFGTFSQGGSVRVSVSLTNTLPTRSNLTASDPGFGLSLGPCSQLPLGVAVFKGNIPPGNLSEHAPLGLYYPGVGSCPAGIPIAYWSFAPESDNVTLVGPGPANASNTEDTRGSEPGVLGILVGPRAGCIHPSTPHLPPSSRAYTPLKPRMRGGR